MGTEMGTNSAGRRARVGITLGVKWHKNSFGIQIMGFSQVTEAV